MKEVAVGIILNNGRVLACQRKRGARYPLKWEFPGGKVEVGETVSEALARELREELAIVARVDDEFFRQEWIYQDSGSYGVTYFIIRSYAGEPENHVFEQIQWVTPEALATMDILEGNREAVDRLVRYAKEQHTHTQP